jgi:Family of unknown function (DUF6228)
MSRIVLRAAQSAPCMVAAHFERSAEEKMETRTVAIRSSKDGTELVLSADDYPRSDAMSVSLVGPAISAQLATSTYHVGSPALFFERMAANWRGWKGEYRWATLEDDFRFVATSDKLGHVDLVVEMRSDSYPRAWEVRAHLALEAGGLDDIFKRVKAVFPIHEGTPRD